MNSYYRAPVIIINITRQRTRGFRSPPMPLRPALRLAWFGSTRGPASRDQLCLLLPLRSST